MGFDVTFHPIAEEEIHHYVFDVFADGSLAAERARELTSDANELAVIMKLYGLFPEWKTKAIPVANTFAFTTAILAGFVHAYWYARDAAVTFLAEGVAPELRGVFVALGQLSGSPLSNLRKPGRAMVFGNESASGFIPPGRIGDVQGVLDALGARPGRGGLNFLETVIDEDGASSLRAALNYCRERGVGMIEASDVVTPAAGRCITRYANMRAPFLDNMA